MAPVHTVGVAFGEYSLKFDYVFKNTRSLMLEGTGMLKNHQPLNSMLAFREVVTKTGSTVLLLLLPRVHMNSCYY